MTHRRWREERGSAAIEAAVAGPAVVLMICLVILGGRVALAHQAIQTIAADTARAASIARSAPEARRAATQAMTAGFDQQLPCTSRDLALDLAGFTKPVGTPAAVSATVTCRLGVAELGLPLPGPITVTATMTSPLDTYRERR